MFERGNAAGSLNLTFSKKPLIDSWCSISFKCQSYLRSWIQMSFGIRYLKDKLEWEVPLRLNVKWKRSRDFLNDKSFPYLIISDSWEFALQQMKLIICFLNIECQVPSRNHTLSEEPRYARKRSSFRQNWTQHFERAPTNLRHLVFFLKKYSSTLPGLETWS